MTGKILLKIADCLDNLADRLFPHPKMPEGPVMCNVSPFNSQFSALALGYGRMQENGATPTELREYICANPITTREGQWRVPIRFPTHEEHLKINAEVLGRSYD